MLPVYKQWSPIYNLWPLLLNLELYDWASPNLKKLPPQMVTTVVIIMAHEYDRNV